MVKDIGNLVPTDLAVFANCLSREDIKYVQTFKDQASKYVTAFGWKRNNEALANLSHYMKVDSIKLGNLVRSYHADRAGVLRSAMNSASEKNGKLSVKVRSAWCWGQNILEIYGGVLIKLQCRYTKELHMNVSMVKHHMFLIYKYGVERHKLGDLVMNSCKRLDWVVKIWFFIEYSETLQRYQVLIPYTLSSVHSGGT